MGRLPKHSQSCTDLTKEVVRSFEGHSEEAKRNSYQITDQFYGWQKTEHFVFNDELDERKG